MDYIHINDKKIPYPNDFQMKREPNIVAEFTTMSGRNVADVNGWKFADATLEWDYLYDTELQNLLNETAKGTFDFTFTDFELGEITVKAFRRSRVSTKTCMKENGDIVWKEIELTFSFPEGHSD